MEKIHYMFVIGTLSDTMYVHSIVHIIVSSKYIEYRLTHVLVFVELEGFIHYS